MTSYYNQVGYDLKTYHQMERALFERKIMEVVDIYLWFLEVIKIVENEVF